MINVTSPSAGVETGTEPYSALYLLPSAPRRLIAEAYRLLSATSASDEGGETMRDAYARIMAASPARPRSTSRGEDAGATERWHMRFPWDVLHIRREAPASVVDVACRVRSGAAEPPSQATSAEVPGRELNGVARDHPPRIESEESPIATTTEPGVSMTVRARRVAGRLSWFHRREPADADPEEARRWLEIKAPCRVEQHLPPSAPAAMRRDEAVHAHLVSEAAGTGAVRAAIGAEPLTIGTDAAGDIEVAKSRSGNSAGAVARVWARDGGFMLHALGDDPGVLLNGRRMTWALLEDGDRLQIGSDVLRFESPRHSQEAGGEVIEQASSPPKAAW